MKHLRSDLLCRFALIVFVVEANMIRAFRVFNVCTLDQICAAAAFHALRVWLGVALH